MLTPKCTFLCHYASHECLSRCMDYGFLVYVSSFNLMGLTEKNALKSNICMCPGYMKTETFAMETFDMERRQCRHLMWFHDRSTPLFSTLGPFLKKIFQRRRPKQEKTSSDWPKIVPVCRTLSYLLKKKKNVFSPMKLIMHLCYVCSVGTHQRSFSLWPVLLMLSAVSLFGLSNFVVFCLQTTIVTWNKMYMDWFTVNFS